MKLLVIYAHLIGTCLALGVMAMTDLRLLARVLGYRVVIPPPSIPEMRLITSALAVLLATGAMLVVLGQQEDPNYLIGNEKLQAKIVLVGLLCLNALLLHFGVFKLLERLTPVAQWTGPQRNAVALSVGLSNSLWLYCAFLGVARPWNQGIAFENVLAIGLAAWLTLASGVRVVLAIAARNEARGRSDWIDALKRSFDRPLESRPDFADTDAMPHRLHGLRPQAA